MLGSVGLATGAGSHLLGGGRLPHAAVLLALLAVSVVVSARFLLTWAGAGRLVVLVVLAQSGWHLVLSLLAGHAGDASAGVPAPAPLPLTDAAGRTGSLHDAYLATVPVAPAPPGPAREGLLAHQVEHVAGQGASMVLAHVLGAALLGLFLARGEVALWRLLALAAARTLATTRVPAPVPLSLQVTRPGPVRPPRVPVATSQVLGRGTPTRRGPPFLLAA